MKPFFSKKEDIFNKINYQKKLNVLVLILSIPLLIMVGCIPPNGDITTMDSDDFFPSDVNVAKGGIDFRRLRSLNTQEQKIYKENFQKWLDDPEKKGKCVFISDEKVEFSESCEDFKGNKSLKKDSTHIISEIKKGSKEPYLLNLIYSQDTMARTYDEIDKLRFIRGDDFSIHLKGIFMKNVSRGLFDKGELAIFANVYEEGEPDQKNQEARLVFYKEDFTPNSYFPFTNIQFYGPKTYSGSRVYIKFKILEIDESEKIVKELLSKLVKEGLKISSTSSPAYNILSEISKVFFEGSSDDTEFEYLINLESQEGSSEGFFLEAGYYVFMRLDKGTVRSWPEIWDELKFNTNDAKIYKKNKNHEWVPYTENSYVVMQIRKGQKGLLFDLDQNTYQNAIKSLRVQTNDGRVNIDAIDKVAMVAIKRSQIINFHKAKDLLRQYEETQNELMNGVKKGQPQSERLLSDLLNISKELVLFLKDSVKGPIDGKSRKNPYIELNLKNPASSAKLSYDQVDYIIKKLKQFSNPDNSKLSVDNLVLDKHQPLANGIIYSHLIKPLKESSR